MYSGTVFVVSWKRRNKKNALEDLPFYVLKANGIASSAEKQMANELK
jgi:hypothetical protein